MKMSALSQLWRKHGHRWYRRGIDEKHSLRRYLAYYVARRGFEIGEYSYGTPIIRQWVGPSRLVVGRYCGIGDSVEFILGGDHRVDRVTTFPMSMLPGYFGGVFLKQSSCKCWSCAGGTSIKNSSGH